MASPAPALHAPPQHRQPLEGPSPQHGPPEGGRRACAATPRRTPWSSTSARAIDVHGHAPAHRRALTIEQLYRIQIVEEKPPEDIEQPSKSTRMVLSHGTRPQGGTVRSSREKERPRGRAKRPCPCGSGKKYKKCCGRTDAGGQCMNGPKGFLIRRRRGGREAPGQAGHGAHLVRRPGRRSPAAFTRNRVAAAPVILSRARVALSGKARAVLVNSGNANACTGERGLADAERLTARACRADPGGRPRGGAGLLHRRHRTAAADGADGERRCPPFGDASAEDIEPFARSIMTTDAFPKVAHREVEAEGGVIRRSATAKGAGMIRPDMATMLAFVVTDARVDAPALQQMLGRAVERTFNRITVDGDTSTNDTFIALASGLSGAPDLSRGPRAGGAVRRSAGERLPRTGAHDRARRRGGDEARGRDGAGRVHRGATPLGSPSPSPKARSSRPRSTARTPTGAGSRRPWAAAGPTRAAPSTSPWAACGSCATGSAWARTPRRRPTR